MYINQQDAQILMNNLYFFVNWLYMFQTIISPSSGATFNRLYSASGTYRYVWQHPDVPVCTNCAVQLIKCCSWWWTNDSLKYVEPVNEKINIIHKNLCISLVYIHIAIWRQVHTTSHPFVHMERYRDVCRSLQIHYRKSMNLFSLGCG